MSDRDASTHARRSQELVALFAQLEELVVTNPVEAVRAASAAIDDTDRAAGIDDRLHLRRMLAMAYAHTSQFELALATCNGALAIPGAERAPIEAARVRLASMQPLANLGHIDEAIEEGGTALRTLESGDSGALAGRAALNIGAIHAMMGRPSEALPYFDRAREHFGDDTVLLGQIETNRGTALAALDRFREAEAAFERAASLLNTDELSWAASIAEENLADLVSRQGAYNRSLRYFERSRRHLERDEAWGDLGRLNAEEATVLARMGLTSIARDAFANAIDMLGEHGTPTDRAMAQIVYGITLVDANDLDAAGEVLAQTSPLVDAEQNADLYHQFVLLSARLAIARGDGDTARADVETGMTLTMDLPVQQLRWQILQASCHVLDGNIPEARATLTEALAIADKAQVSPLVAQIRQMLAEIARASGQDELANSHARKAINAYESIRETIQADRLRQSWHHGRLGVYGDLYLSLVARDDATAQREAFGIAERIRSRTLLDAMHLSAADVESAGPVSDTARPLIEEMDDHRRWLNWMYSALADGREPEPEKLDELQARERAAAILSDRLNTLRPPSGFSTILELEQVQELLDESSMILSYLTVGERLTVQVITPTEVHGVADLASLHEVAELAIRLQFQVGRALVHGSREPNSSRQARLQRDMDAVLAQLYQALIAPIEPWMSGRDRAIVLPSGELYSVPFAALKQGGAYLVDRLEIVTAPGISVLVGLRERTTGPRHGAKRPLVVGVPDAAAPDLGEEARMVAGRFANTTLLLGDDATQDAVLGSMPDADLVHLALHGRFDADHPTASGLRVADDWLTLDELTELQLANSPLIVLTGCETGRVRVGAGDDLEGMLAALIAAGARGIVTSLWKTHDRAAAALAAALYDALDDGHDPAAALRRAQQSARERCPHPALWAPFVAVHPTSQGAQA